MKNQYKLHGYFQLHIDQENITPSTACKSRGMTLDKHMNMEAQIKYICRSANFHLRNIRIIRDLVTPEAAEQLVHSLITSSLDYCNSLLYGLPSVRTGLLQRVQNMAVRLVTGTAIDDHITPVFKSLHWLPIKFRILFKFLLLTYKCVNNLAPPYLCSLVKLDTRSRVLRSNGQFHLKVPRSRLVTYGDSFFLCDWSKGVE